MGMISPKFNLRSHQHRSGGGLAGNFRRRLWMFHFAAVSPRSEVVIAVVDAFGATMRPSSRRTPRFPFNSFNNEQTMTQALRERLDALYAAFKRGQLDFVLNAFDDSAEFISHTPAHLFPFLGHRRGKSAIAEAFKEIHEELEFISYEPVSKVLEADEAAVMLFIRVINRRTGRSIQLSLAHFLKFRDGKIVELREFMDSFSAAEQHLGRALDVGGDYHLV
jgi:ketosteroid isomerase-like protein